MKEVDLYDFDKTLFPFDSGSKFALFCVLHYPWCAVFIPLTAGGAILALAHVISWSAFKKICFSFMALIPRDKAIKSFWDRYESRVFPWVKDRTRESVIISASPDFLLEDIQKRLGFEGLICTRHNKKTGAIIGKNCRAEEKVRRFKEEYGDTKVCDVYSDSVKHDAPMFALAGGRCFNVVRGEKIEFKYEDLINR